MEIRIDSRQVAPGSLRGLVEKAMAAQAPDSEERRGRIYFEDFRPFRQSIVWEFNRLYWQRVKDWEKATGKGYQEALPGGKSDGTDAQAVSDSVEEFWKLLKELDASNRLPQEIFILEIGVGMGAHAGMWLDQFLRPRPDARDTFLSAPAILAG